MRSWLIWTKRLEATNEATGGGLVTQMAFPGQRDKGHHDSAVFFAVYFGGFPFQSSARDFSSLLSNIFFLLTPGIVAEQFLNNTATQLTYHGLCELTSTVQEGELCVFFRNNHFSTMIKFKVRGDTCKRDLVLLDAYLLRGKKKKEKKVKLSLYKMKKIK